MKPIRTALLACAATAALLGSIWLPRVGSFVPAKLSFAPLPYFVGSRIALTAVGLAPNAAWSVLGPARISKTSAGLRYLSLLAPGSAQVVAGDGRAIAARSVTVLPAPPKNATLIAVACYDDGVAFYDARTLSMLGVLATGGSPSDLAAANGRLAVTDNDGSAFTVVTRAPWRVSYRPLSGSDEIAAAPDGTFFATLRDFAGLGAVARVSARPTVTKTGLTAEGIALDARRDLLYVANVNDGSILELDARTMKPLARIEIGARVFSLALDADGSHLYAVRNGGLTDDDGDVVEIATQPRRHVVARSALLNLPLGVALDQRAHRLFVTDEASDVIYVLDPQNLRALHAPLQTCHTPWDPTFDARSDRLYVPCARDDRLDIFDASTLARIPGAPIHTAGYPLSVALWR